MNLSTRLEKVLGQINDAKIVADIGTDHAYLPIAIIASKKAELVYAADINAKPLLSAQTNIEKFGYQNQIFTVLSNGLEFIKNDFQNELDYVTISGLGTQTILSILKNDSSRIKNYVICSNTDISQLRAWVNDQNYKIEFEDFFEDYKVNYWLITISKKNIKSKLTEQEIRFGQKVYFENNHLYKQYLQSEIVKLEKIISQIKNDDQRVAELRQQQKEIEVYLNEIK